ncbi:MAG: histidine phosphatase family protein [Gemmatimonadetes bacterium]|nr:histidine phosphatase family protein [Gemmatimonadota bacterium]
MRRRSFLPLASLLLAALPSLLAPLAVGAQSDATVVYLVRHAERAEDGTSDPVISLPGWDRSRLLAEMLADAGLTNIHTTDLRRTRATGRPTAEAQGLDMDLYDPRDLSAFADRLRGMPGRHLVLGHSNTTPQLVSLLGGEPGDPIEELEYDRLYIVTLGDEGASTVLIRFGSPFEG